MELKTYNISVGYDKKSVVENINFNIHPGEILALLGKNGCGKSTILKSIMQELDLISGNVSYLNQDIKKFSIKERAKLFSYITTQKQNPMLMKAEEVAALGRYPYTDSFFRLREEDLKKIDDALKTVGAENLRKKNFSTLSDGEKQRIKLAALIVQDADILLLDEPTSYLDISFKMELLRILRNLSENEGKIIILTLHEIELAYLVSDYVMLISEGEVFDYGVPQDVLNEESIRKVYGLKSEDYSLLFKPMFANIINEERKNA